MFSSLTETFKNSITRPHLWLWAFDIMLLMNLFFLLVSPAQITAGDVKATFLISEVPELLFKLSIAAHLFPFDIHLETVRPPYNGEVIISADLFLGFIFMISGFLFVIINTRRYMDGIYITIPFLLYSYLMLALISWLVLDDIESSYVLKPYPTAVLLTIFTLSSGVSATLIARRFIRPERIRELDPIDIELH